MTSISFLGATGTVTGSKYLVEAEEARVLVDCGLFQGARSLRERNWSALSNGVGKIDSIVLTHGHIDHSGYLPRLWKDGFRGRVYCTPGTRDLLHILLPDAGHLQEEEAQFANRHAFSRHRPALPLYTRPDAEACLGLLTARDFGEDFTAAPGISVRFSRAGHIVGSSCVRLETRSATVAFSGDVGRPIDPIMRAPEPLPAADYLVVESTYGDRRHPSDSVLEALSQLVLETSAKGGAILVPAFAVGRAQHLLHILSQLRSANRIPELPIFLDSPMAIDATDLFCRHKEDHRLSEADCHAMCKAAIYTRTTDASKAIDRRAGPMVIVSASGMATGGRILHHLRHFLPDERSAVLMVGYQSIGTRGRALVDGASELRIHGQQVPVRARIAQIQGLSAHADCVEMVHWLRKSSLTPRRVFITHGEPAASAAFQRRLQDELGWDATVPRDGSTHRLA